MHITAVDLMLLKIIDGIVPEHGDGNWNDPGLSYRALGGILKRDLSALMQTPPDALVQARQERFRNY